MSTSSFSRAERDGERRGGGVGVHVVHRGRRASGATDGDHRDAAGIEQVADRGGVDLRDVADEAEVDLLAVDDGVRRLGGEQPGVLPGEADGERAVLVDQRRRAPGRPGRRAPSGPRPSPRAW